MAFGNSIDFSYSGNGGELISDERANSTAQFGGQDGFAESYTETAFEDSAKDEARIS